MKVTNNKELVTVEDANVRGLKRASDEESAA